MSSKRKQETETVIVEQVEKPHSDSYSRQYLKGKFLGKGGFARVYEMTSLETRKIYASKIINKSSLLRSRARQKLMSEIRIHRSLDHEHIVRFEHFFEDKENVYILLEVCENQTMTELVRRRKRLTELEVQTYTLQMISALSYIHSKRIIHRDLKIGNLFINNKMQIKLGDFGLACKLDYEGETRETICGTPNYIAPEVLDGDSGHSYEADIWSLGVVIYTLLVGKPPFETHDVKKTYNLIRMNIYSFPEKLGISEQAKDLVNNLLKTNPKERLSLKGIIGHPFFSMGLSIPRVLPTCTLAVPPSSAFIEQYMPDKKNNFPLTKSLPCSLQSSPRDFALKKTRPVSVKKWIDFSDKYGLAYILSNGSIGVCFNDTSKAIMEPKSDFFVYIERKDKTDVLEEISLVEYPRHLYKKVALIYHFKKQLEGGENKDSSDRTVYVKKWVTTRQCILFKLSDRVVQVVFRDKTELFVSAKNVTFISKKGESTCLKLKEAVGVYRISKRIRYTRDILNNMLGLNHN